jgi:hypothetical protein
MHVLFDIRKLDLRGSTMRMGCAQSYSIALFEIELSTQSAARLRHH